MEWKDIARWVKDRVQQGDFMEFLAETLLALCAVETVPSRDLHSVRRREEACFQIIRANIQDFGLHGVFEKHPFSPSIRKSPAYTFPFYAGTEEAYASRYNLVYRWRSTSPSRKGRPLGINAHIDTVAPFFHPFRKGPHVFGRGACDDKGGCTAMIASVRLMREVHEQFGKTPENDLTFMFVTDEEMGGNGSLSLSLDRELKKTYEAMIILESCNNQIHPSNRGALWYRLSIPKDTPDPINLALEAILELEREGQAIKAESNHPLFPKSAVQTNHGILGPYGEFPSRICGHIELELSVPCSRGILLGLLGKGLETYTHLYGDKSRELSAENGTPKVSQHFDLEPLGKEEDNTYLLKVWGRTGHMGSIAENDNALTKAAFLVDSVQERYARVKLSFPGVIPQPLILEGGQGFVPTHTIDQIKERLTAAVRRVYQRLPWHGKGVEPRMSFDKLHNDSFDGIREGPCLRAAVKSAEMVGVELSLPVEGWTVSCDARLFAKEYPGMEVLTLGPGKVQYAHSDNEHIDLIDLAKGSASLALLFYLQGEF